MDIDSYTIEAAKTAIYPQEWGVAYVTFGLVNEAGEVAGKFKKALRDDGGVLTEERRQAMIDELGDVYWYAANLCKELGVEASEVLERNLEKLRSRAERGTLTGDGDNR